MATASQITVYLQALGGHFLGPHAYKTDDIRIHLHYPGGTADLPYILTKDSDDGIVTSAFTSGTSTFMPIITIPSGDQPQTTVNFLSTDSNTICGTALIPMPEKIEMAELEVSIPTTLDKLFHIRQQVILRPGTGYHADPPVYKIIIVVPGLYLSESKIEGIVSVYVKMMCGCAVTPGPPASLWPAADFDVMASVLDGDGGTTTYTLTYDTAQTGNSLFSAQLSPGQLPIRSVTFTASQKSTGNYGVLVQKY